MTGSTYPSSVAAGTRDEGPRTRAAKPWPALHVIAGSVAVHLIAAAVVYRDLVRNLYEIFDERPRLLVLEHGLARLTALIAFLPPVAPSLLLIGVAVWVGAARRERAVARWLSLAMVILAADGALRALGVAIAPAVGTPGELFDLPVRFSPGPRLVVDLLGAHPGGAVMYWLVSCSFAALASLYCAASALHAAEESALEPVERRRRRRDGDSIGQLQALVVATGGYVAIVAAGQLALPPLMQMLMRFFG